MSHISFGSKESKGGNMKGIETYIIINIIASCFLLYSLYERIYAGRFIIKIQRRKISVLYTVVLALYIYVTGDSLLDYTRGKSVNINTILQGVTWIQICALNLLSRAASGVAKGGIYSGDSKSSHFTKWSRIKSYTWISDNVIQFELLGRENRIVNTEFKIDTRGKEEVDNLLNEFIGKKSNEINKERKLRAIVLIVFIGILMFIGYGNLIRIGKLL